MTRSTWLWRWRDNPLRRRSYAVEGWSLLAASLLTVLAAATTGLAVAAAEQHHLARERAGRHPTAAVLTQDAPAAGGYPYGIKAAVRWTAPDGTGRVGRTKVDAGLEQGAPVTIWTDARGRLVPAPPSAGVASFEAAVLGSVAATGLALVAAAGGILALRAADRRRAEAWADEWAEVGPRWDRRNA